MKNNQKQVLDYIKKYHAEHGYVPSIREICDGTNYASPSTVHNIMLNLFRDGYLKTDAEVGTARAYMVVKERKE